MLSDHKRLANTSARITTTYSWQIAPTSSPPRGVAQYKHWDKLSTDTYAAGLGVRRGVTLVSSLLVGRQNASGGESSVFDVDGRLLLTTTLSEPGALLLGDDRRTLHSVSPVRPVDRSRPAYCDVLVVTFKPGRSPVGVTGLRHARRFRSKHAFPKLSQPAKSA